MRLLPLIIAIATLLLSPAGGSVLADPPKLDPKPMDVFKELGTAQPGIIYSAQSRALGISESERRDRPIRYLFRVPQGFSISKPRNVIIVLHPDNADERWGFMTHDPAAFRPDDIVVCPEGSSPVAENLRSFRGDAPDAVSMRDFVLEMSRVFPTAAIILYGHAEGGQFATWLAGEFPRMIDGVVASSSAAWEKARTRGSIWGVPIVFVHGTADTKIYYRDAVLARDAYLEDAHPRVALRPLRGGDHKPHPAEAARCIDWCIAQRTDDPKIVLACAQRLAAPQDGEFAPPLGMASRALKRLFEKETKPPLKDVDEATRKAAWDLSLKIEAYAQRHIDILKAQIKANTDLKLDPKATGAEQGWLGHISAVSEDLRAIEAVDTYLAAIGFDQAAAEHADKAAEVIEAVVSGETLTAEKVTAIVEGAPDMFLCDAFGPDFFDQFEQLRKRSDRNRDQIAQKAGIVQIWREALENGRATYARIAREWK